VICSGSSDRQVQALADAIKENMKNPESCAWHRRGEYGKWVLMDYNDVIVHIFFEPTREFYDIERLCRCAQNGHGDDNLELTALNPECNVEGDPERSCQRGFSSSLHACGNGPQ